MKLKRAWNNGREITSEQLAKIAIAALEGMSWNNISRFSETSHCTVWKYRQLFFK